MRRCSLETRAFWLEILCVMHETEEPILSGSFEEIARLVGCESAEVARCVLELKRTNTADVTIGHGDVTVLSRRLERELNGKESNKLRKRRERESKNVTTMSHDRVRSKSKSKIKEEEREDGAASPTSQKSHPAIVAIFEASGTYPPTEIFQDIIDRLGTQIDLVKLKDCFRKWRVKGYKKTNYNWAMDWYVDGIPEGNKNGNGQFKSEREKSADRGSNALALIAELERQGRAEEQALFSENGGTGTSHDLAIEPAEPN